MKKNSAGVSRNRNRHRSGLGARRLVFPAMLFVAGCSLWLFSRCSSSSSEEVPEVKVAVADTSSVEIFDEYDGIINAIQSVEVTARVEGILEKILFKEGSYVKKGQTLFVIDPKLYQAQVDRAAAQVDRAKALKDKAGRDLSRIRPLYAQKAASQVDLDNAEAAVECAEADVEISRVDLLEAQITLGYTRVSAPISGYISKRMADVGALVGPGSRAHLATIVRSDTVMVDFSMTSLQYLRCRDRDVNIRCDEDGECIEDLPSYVTIMLADGSEYPFRGVVDFADPMVDSGSGMLSVRAEVPNPERCLIPGEKIKVKVLLDEMGRALAVPAAALRRDSVGKGAFVFVIADDGSVEKRAVTAGAAAGNMVVVESGLNPGEMVAVNNFGILPDARRVKPVGMSAVNKSKKTASMAGK